MDRKKVLEILRGFADEAANVASGAAGRALAAKINAKADEIQVADAVIGEPAVETKAK